MSNAYAHKKTATNGRFFVLDEECEGNNFFWHGSCECVKYVYHVFHPQICCVDMCYRVKLSDTLYLAHGE